MEHFFSFQRRNANDRGQICIPPLFLYNEMAALIRNESYIEGLLIKFFINRCNERCWHGFRISIVLMSLYKVNFVIKKIV